MNPESIIERLGEALPVISQICDISGVPGTSIGLFNEDLIIYTTHLGYRDVATQLPPTSDTTYGIGSLTKGFVAASLARLIDERPLVTWSTPIQDILPGYEPEQPALEGNVSLIDFLSHRTGLSGDLSLALQGDQELLLPPSATLPVVSRLETVAPFRESWHYNDWGYSVAGAVIEELSGVPAHQYIRETVLGPLGLDNTTTRPDLDYGQNFAEAYASLENATAHHLPRTLPFKDSVFESADGMYSNVNDMLKYAQTVLRSHIDPESSTLKNMDMIFQGHIPLDKNNERLGSYGMGWIETYLPGVVGLQGDNAKLFDRDELPVLGHGPPIKTFYHQSARIGYGSGIYLFPESKSGFVVLTNSMGLSDAADWIAQVITTALFGFDNTADYVHLAKESHRRKVAKVSAMGTEFENIRQSNPDEIPRSLEVYTGWFEDTLGLFAIHIRRHPSSSRLLELAFQGWKTQVYELRHLHDDVFEWAMGYDEQAQRARFIGWRPEYFTVEFQFDDKGHPVSLKWAGGQRLTRKSAAQTDGLLDEGDDEL